MRLKGISTIAEANKFLPLYNRKFACKAQKEEDLHRAIPKETNLDNILCIKTERTVRNDNTIAHKKKLYQIEESVKGGKAAIEEHINGRMIIRYDGNSLKFKEIEVRPEKQQKQ